MPVWVTHLSSLLVAIIPVFPLKKMQHILQIFLSQRIGFGIEKVDKSLLPEFYAYPNQLEASLLQRIKAMELCIG